MVSRWTAQGEGTAGAALDRRLGREGNLRCAVRRLPGAGGNRCAAVEAVIAELAVQAGGHDSAQGAGRPGVGQQVAVGIECGPARPGAFEEVEVVAAVDARDRIKAKVFRHFNRAEVLVLDPLQYVIGP